ncbi:hypothetical protein [Butyrivibrio sp. WCE2006]|uniref:hypothetical protein n=1 Tax=Butyrivibrio sp. WCE2006 TaxID=1410611 RepID=UPI0005D192C0|nr:hypothetical protein [Butyrivibrio sp. WCE2006]
MEEKKITYKDILKIPNCRKLISSNLINRFGDSVDAIAFTWLVYQITGSATWSALIFGLNQLPGIFVQPFAFDDQGPSAMKAVEGIVSEFCDEFTGDIKKAAKSVQKYLELYLKND